MERKPQSLANHGKFDPKFHFFLAPLALAGLIWSIWHAVQDPGMPAYLQIAVALWALIAVFTIRIYSLKVQDRVIRLEERLRIDKLVSEPTKSRALSELTESQYIALRFASDGELPGLIDKTLGGKLDSKQIKSAITNWRPDYWRV
jgi:uncharacterized protein DUF6526